MGTRRTLRCGIAIHIGRAVMSIITIAIFYLLAIEFWTPLKAEADEQVVNATAQEATNWIGIGFDNYLLLTLLITVMGVISVSVWLRQGGF